MTTKPLTIFTVGDACGCVGPAALARRCRTGHGSGDKECTAPQ